MNYSISSLGKGTVLYPNIQGKPHIKRQLRFITLIATDIAPTIGQSEFYFLVCDNDGIYYMMDQNSGSAGIGVFLHRLNEAPPANADIRWCLQHKSHSRYESLVGRYPAVPFFFESAHFEFCVIEH